MAIIAELLDKLKDARKTVELTDACGKRVCSSKKHWNCPYGNEGMTDCVERLEAAYEDTIENLLQLAEALISSQAEDQGLVNAPRPAWIPVTERLPELQSWGASEVVLGLIKSENAPSLNKLHNLTLCVYCDNGIWSMPGRYVAITHWMPLPEPPEG